MDELKRVPKAILEQLQEHFDQLIPRCLFLVKQDTYPKRVYKTPGSTAVKGNISIAFRIEEESESFVCEYFLDADGYTEHRRYFLASDQVEMLENYEGQYDEDDTPYEEVMRVMKHNKAVRDLLIKKGFVKK